jgi:hypothetical protein
LGDIPSRVLPLFLKSSRAAYCQCPPCPVLAVFSVDISLRSSKNIPRSIHSTFAQVRQRWVEYDKRQNSIGRPWIYLTSLYSANPTLVSNNPNIAIPRVAPLTPHYGMMEPFNDHVVTPRQSSKKAANSIYGNTIEAVKHFLKTDNSRVKSFSNMWKPKSLKRTTAIVEQIPSPPDLRVIDPPKNTAKGRKRNARYKGKDETQKSSKKQCERSVNTLWNE